MNALEPGDIIYSVDGVEIDERTQNLETYIKLTQTAGGRVAIKVLRDGEELQMQIGTLLEKFRK